MDSSALCRRWPRWWMGLKARRNQKTLTWPTNKTRLWARRKERIWLNKSWITANKHLIQLSADIIRPQLITHSGHPLTIGRPGVVLLTSAPASDALDTGEGAAGRWPAVWWMKSSVRARKYTFSVTGRGKVRRRNVALPVKRSSFAGSICNTCSGLSFLNIMVALSIAPLLAEFDF